MGFPAVRCPETLDGLGRRGSLKTTDAAIVEVGWPSQIAVKARISEECMAEEEHEEKTEDEGEDEERSKEKKWVPKGNI